MNGLVPYEDTLASSCVALRCKNWANIASTVIDGIETGIFVMIE